MKVGFVKKVGHAEEMSAILHMAHFLMCPLKAMESQLSSRSAGVRWIIAPVSDGNL